MMPLHWTSAQDDEIRKAFQERVPMYKIAAAHGVSRTFLYSRLEELGVIPPLQNKVVWTHKNDQDLQDFYHKKVPMKVMAEHFGLTYQEVRRRLYDVGLVRPREPNIEPQKLIATYVPMSLYEKMQNICGGKLSISRFVLDLVQEDLKYKGPYIVKSRPKRPPESKKLVGIYVPASTKEHVLMKCGEYGNISVSRYLLNLILDKLDPVE